MTDLIIARNVPHRTRIGILHFDLKIRLCDYCGSQVVKGRLSRGYRTCSPECNQKYWARVKELDRLSGKRSPTFWPLYREECLKRDNYECRECGAEDQPGRFPLEVHHITPLYRGGTNQLENLITLCHKCHMAQHATRPPVLDPAQKTVEEWV